MSFTDELKTAKAIAEAVAMLLPAICSLVKSIEDAMPPGTGAEKLKCVEAILQNVYSSYENAVVTWEKIWPSLRAVINYLVLSYNTIGVFKHAK